MKWFYLLDAVKVRHDANIRCVFVCVSIATGLECFVMRAFCKCERLRIGWLWLIFQLQMAFCHSANLWPSTTISAERRFTFSCSFISYLHVALFSNVYVSPGFFFCQFYIKQNTWLKFIAIDYEEQYFLKMTKFYFCSLYFFWQIIPDCCIF